jgi:hypothetical protein
LGHTGRENDWIEGKVAMIKEEEMLERVGVGAD